MAIIRKIKRSIKWVFGRLDKYPIMILPYNSYGTEEEIYLRGRVLEDKNIRPSKDDRLTDLIKYTYKRFQTEEKPDLRVTASVSGSEYSAVTNFEGYFKINQPIKGLDVDERRENWVNVTYQLNNQPDVTAKSKMLIPRKSVDYGIISDIDDTILHTGVTSFLKLKVIYNTILKSAMDREPLTGASILYRALKFGVEGTNSNPFFYISNSPWNLYNYLNIFLREKKFPKGPVLLRDFAMPWEKNYKTEKHHKQREIENIFRTYPQIKFILFGDSAEHDATIYSDIAKKFPKQVICVYLHAVKKEKKMRKIRNVIEDSEHVQMVLVQNAIQAAEHAFSNQLITEEAYENIVKNTTLEV